MASVTFDKKTYRVGETAKITYANIGGRSTLQVWDANVRLILQEQISGNGTYEWQVGRSVPLGVCTVYIYTPPTLTPVARAEAEILKGEPIKPIKPEPPEGYTDMFTVCPDTISLAPGIYDIILTLRGYQNKKISNVVINNGKLTEISAELVSEVEANKSYIDCNTVPSGARIWLKRV